MEDTAALIHGLTMLLVTVSVLYGIGLALLGAGFFFFGWRMRRLEAAVDELGRAMAGRDCAAHASRLDEYQRWLERHDREIRDLARAGEPVR